MVDVFIRYAKPVNAGDAVELTIAGRHYHQALRGNQDFGEEKLQFAVTEFAAKSPAQLTWNAEGRRQHKDQSIDPEKKWTLFLVPHIHLDVGYTDYQAKVAAIQSRVIDEAMDLTAQHPDFRFSIDGEWDLEQFMKTRTPAEQQRAITAIQKRTIICSRAIWQFAHRFRHGGDAHPFTLRQCQLQPRTRYTLQLRQHHRRSIVHVVVCIDPGISGPQVFPCRQR